MELPAIAGCRRLARRWLDAAWHGNAASTALCAVLAACLLLCIWGYTLLRIGDEVQQALDRARIENRDVATILAAQLDDALGALPALPADLAYFLRPYREISRKAHGRIEIAAAGAVLAALQDGLPARALDDIGDADKAAGLREVRTLLRHGLQVRVSQERARVLAQLDGMRLRLVVQAALVSLAVLSLGGAVVWAAGRRLRAQRRQAEGEHITLSLQLARERSRADLLATCDELTGLAKRRHFYDIASARLLQARHSRNHYALLLVDMDRFKHVNERLGQLAGDALLQEAARRLRHLLRDGDVLARFGGDAFVLLLCEVASEERLAAVAGGVLEALRRPFAAAGEEILATASIGIALYPRDGQSVDALLSGAGSAMDSAKAARDSFRFFDMALNLSSARSLELQGRFEPAMRDDEFCLHYQGKFDTARGHIVGLEALLRWDHPQHGLIFPNEFIGLAEETQSILALGNWSIAAACRQLAQWRQEGLPLVPVAINISARQLRDPRLLASVTCWLETYALAPALLELEVTESCFIDDISQAKDVLVRLRALGVTISLDDYGTGYSGLSHIRMLPIHTLKIDRSFIRDIAIDRNDAMIVASTIALARGLGLQVVAEGVESGEQLERLRRLGCQQVQGFYLHRPAPAAAIAALLASVHPARAPAM